MGRQQSRMQSVKCKAVESGKANPDESGRISNREMSNVEVDGGGVVMRGCLVIMRGLCGISFS